MFRGLVGKHTGRVHDFAEERQFFWRFFDARSFAIMAVMMTGGITIRVMHLAPDAFIAIFYTGLGTALALAGLAFGCQFLLKFVHRFRSHLRPEMAQAFCHFSSFFSRLFSARLVTTWRMAAMGWM